MAIGIGSNIFALQAQRQLGTATSALSQTFERLASGQRINRASDDAAGLAIASSLTTNARVYGQAIRNANDGISALSIAQDAVGQLSTIVTRLKELATSAANGSYSRTQRLAIDGEASKLTDEYNRIVATTSFNGRNLLSSSLGRMNIQVGYGASGVISAQVGQGLKRSTGTGTWGEAQVIDSEDSSRIGSFDVNGDGRPDLISMDSTKVFLRLNNGDGTFAASNGLAANTNSYTFGDFNGDGKLDLATTSSLNGFEIRLGRGDGTFNAAQAMSSGNFTEITTGDINGDGKADIVVSQGSNVISFIGNGSGNFSQQSSVNVSQTVTKLKIGDLLGDGKAAVFVGSSSAGSRVTILQSSTQGILTTQQSYSGLGTDFDIGDINHDGLMDIVAIADGYLGYTVLLGQSSGIFKTGATYSIAGDLSSPYLVDYDNDGNLDIVAGAMTSKVGVVTFKGNGNGSFGSGEFSALSEGEAGVSLVPADFNGDGVIDLLGFDNELQTLFSSIQQGQASSGIERFSFATQADALRTLDALSAIQGRISTELGNIGASQSRVGYALGTLSTTRENSIAASARITDVDVSFEAAQLTKNQILQQAAASVLGQANLAPSLALILLQGS